MKKWAISYLITLIAVIVCLLMLELCNLCFGTPVTEPLFAIVLAMVAVFISVYSSLDKYDNNKIC